MEMLFILEVRAGMVSYFYVWCFSVWRGCLIFAFGALAGRDGALFLRLVL